MSSITIADPKRQGRISGCLKAPGTRRCCSSSLQVLHPAPSRRNPLTKIWPSEKGDSCNSCQSLEPNLSMSNECLVWHNASSNIYLPLGFNFSWCPSLDIWVFPRDLWQWLLRWIATRSHHDKDCADGRCATMSFLAIICGFSKTRICFSFLLWTLNQEWQLWFFSNCFLQELLHWLID